MFTGFDAESGTKSASKPVWESGKRAVPSLDDDPIFVNGRGGETPPAWAQSCGRLDDGFRPHGSGRTPPPEAKRLYYHLFRDRPSIMLEFGKLDELFRRRGDGRRIPVGEGCEGLGGGRLNLP